MTQHKVTVSVRTVCYWCSWDCFPRVLSCVRILGVSVAGLGEFCILIHFLSYVCHVMKCKVLKQLHT